MSLIERFQKHDDEASCSGPFSNKLSARIVFEQSPKLGISNSKRFLIMSGRLFNLSDYTRKTNAFLKMCILSIICLNNIGTLHPVFAKDMPNLSSKKKEKKQKKKEKKQQKQANSHQTEDTPDTPPDKSSLKKNPSQERTNSPSGDDGAPAASKSVRTETALSSKSLDSKDEGPNIETQSAQNKKKTSAAKASKGNKKEKQKNKKQQEIAQASTASPKTALASPSTVTPQATNKKQKKDKKKDAKSKKTVAAVAVAAPLIASKSVAASPPPQTAPAIPSAPPSPPPKAPLSQTSNKKANAPQEYDPYDQTGLPIVTIDPPGPEVDLLQGLPLILFMPKDGIKNAEMLEEDKENDN